MMTTYTISLDKITPLDDDHFLAICQANPDLKFERTSQGNLVIMSPTGGETGKKNAEIIGDFINWNRHQKQGIIFDPSTGFKLPNGAIRSPDVSWIQTERWEALTQEERQKFANIAPDFILELRSQTDVLSDVQDNLEEYLENGVRLGWLIDPIQETVEIYRQGKEKEILVKPETISGEAVLVEFRLNLNLVWR